MYKIEIEDKSYLSKDRLEDIVDVDTIYIPLVINFSTNCKLLVKKGDKVKIKQVLATSEELDFGIVSPVSGNIKEISECTYLDGRTVKCIVIEIKGKDKKYKEVDSIPDYTKEEFLEVLKTCGVTSMGGGNFPTYLKYEPLLSVLIVNAVECEPYISSDYALAKEKYKEIIETISSIIKINNIRTCYIAINKKHSDLISLYNEYVNNYSRINIVSVNEFFPMGWEKILVKEITGLSYNNLPQEKGVVVNSISTIYAMFEALKYNKVVDRRIVTISGDRINNPTNAVLRIGTNIKDIYKKFDLKEEESIKLIAGGPMMGRALPDNNLIVTPNLNSVLFIDDFDEKNISPCYRCGKCIEVCPVDIVPVLIKDNVSKNKDLKKLHPEKCIECGLCSYICPSNIDVRSFVKKAKRSV